MTSDDVVRTRSVTATELRHESMTVSLREGLTVVTGLSADRSKAVADALSSGSSSLMVAADDGPSPLQPPAHSPGLVLHLRTQTPRRGGLGAPDGAVASAEVDLQAAQVALTAAEDAYVTAQDELAVLRRDADRGATQALTAAQQALTEAQEKAADLRRKLVAARDDAAGRDADLGAVREMQSRMEALRGQRDELASRLAALPAAIDTAPLQQALDGLQRLRQVKPRPMPRAVAIADRLEEIEASIAALGVTLPPAWLSAPALAAFRAARDDLAALESGKPAVEVDQAKVRAVEAAHEELLEAESKVMEKGNRSNRRRLDEAQTQERDALHTLGLSSYGQFLKYLAPTLDAGVREERLVEARAALADTEAVWAELHGGSVPESLTSMHVERAELREEAAELLGRETEPEALDEALRNHLETVVDTSWAEDALSEAVAATGLPVQAGGLEASAARILEDAPSVNDARSAVEGDISQLGTELSLLTEQLAEAAPPGYLQGEGETATELAKLGSVVAKADEAVAAAEAAVGVEQTRVRAANTAQGAEEVAARAAESNKAAVEVARQSMADVASAVSAAKVAASEAAEATAAAASAVASSSIEARLALLARAVAHHAVGVPLVVFGDHTVLGGAAAAVAALIDVAEVVQVIALFDDDEVVDAARKAGDAVFVASA